MLQTQKKHEKMFNQGLYQEAKGSTTVCSDSREKQDMLHELKSPLSSSNLILQFPANFSSFDIYAPSSGEELIYFTHGNLSLN